MTELSELTDEELLDIVCRGGAEAEAAFAELVQRFVGNLRRYFRSHGCSTGEAEDLTQETWLRVFKAARPEKAAWNFRAFLFRVAENVFIDCVRRKRKERNFLVESGGETQALNDVAGDPQPRPDGRIYARDLLRPVKQLSPKQRAVLRLWLQGYSYLEIAAALGVGVETVKTHLQDALHRLRGLMNATSIQPSVERGPHHE